MKLIKAKNLACPIDGENFEYAEKHLTCVNNHCFDYAKQGYINLLPIQDKRSLAPGDSKEMIAARRDFLDSGVYSQVSDAINKMTIESVETAGQNKGINIFDAGCGEGYYLERLLKLVSTNITPTISLIGMDISKPAIIAATKRNNQDITWIVGTNRKPPILSDSIDCILSIFGFPTYNSFKQILKKNGSIILADSGPNHLRELRDLIYETSENNGPPSLEEAIKEGFKLVEEKKITFKTPPLTNLQIRNLLAMTPHFYRATPAKRDATLKTENLEITIDIIIRQLKTKS